MNDTQKMLKVLNDGFPQISDMGALEAREAVDSRVQPAPNSDDAHSEDHYLSTPNGDLRIRFYQANGRLSDSPEVTVFAHGGGYLHGSIESHDSFCRVWAKDTGHAVVSVNYRLAPEWGPPAPSEDLLYAIEWVNNHLQPERLFLAGDSSGAGACLVAALMLGTEARTALDGMILLYPFVDPDLSFPSHEKYADGYFITRKAAQTYWKHYLNAPNAQDAAAWQIRPLQASQFCNLPPTIVVTAGVDLLQDEGKAVYQQLKDEGVPARLVHFSEQFHGFLTIWGYRPAWSAQAVLWSDIRNFFGKVDAHGG